MAHDPQMAKPSSPGRLIDPGQEARTRQFTQAVLMRVEGIEAGIDALSHRTAILEKRMDGVASPVVDTYEAKRRVKNKWGVNDAADKAIELIPLTKKAAYWLADEMNSAGPDIPNEQYRTLMTQAKRRSEGNGKTA